VHSERLWKQLVMPPDVAETPATATFTETLIVLGFAVAAACAVKVPALFGLQIGGGADPFYAGDASLFGLPLVTIYFVWKRRSSVGNALWLAVPFAAGAVFVNVYPFEQRSDTGVLTVLHLPIALWLAVGVAYVGSRWFTSARRMD